MERLIILLGRLYKSITPTTSFFKVTLVGRFMPLVSGIGRPTNNADERHTKADLWNFEKIRRSVQPICLVGRLVLSVFPLYCSHRLVSDRLVEIDIFGR